MNTDQTAPALQGRSDGPESGNAQKRPAGQYHRHIAPEQPLFSLQPGALLRYVDLMLLYARKNIVVTYRQTVLGSLWLVISPLASSLIQMFVFGYLAGFRTGGAPKIVFYLFSNTAWGLYSAVVNSDTYIFMGNTGLFGKVSFPRMAISYANMLSTTLITGIQFVISWVFLLFFLFRGEIRLSPLLPLSLIPILQLLLLGQGMGLIYASLTVRYRDLSRIFPLATRFLMYISPVVYPLSQLAGTRFDRLILLNPLCPAFEFFRAAIWCDPFPPAWSMVLSLFVTIAVNLCGILVFKRTARTFIDYI